MSQGATMQGTLTSPTTHRSLAPSFLTPAFAIHAGRCHSAGSSGRADLTGICVQEQWLLQAQLRLSGVTPQAGHPRRAAPHAGGTAVQRQR